VPTVEPFFFTVYVAVDVGFVPTVPAADPEEPLQFVEKLSVRGGVYRNTIAPAPGFPTKAQITS